MRCSIEPEKLMLMLLEFRKKNHMSQAELARKLGVPRFTLQRWEKGLVRVSPIMFRMLVERKVVIVDKKTKQQLLTDAALV